MALSHIIWRKPETIIGLLANSELVNDENKGQVMGLVKRMLPQVFKWDDDTRDYSQ